MPEPSSIFDMIGPIMVGPSSSHTAAVVRIGYVARRLLGQQPEEALVTFYNSFATTYQGHGSDRAVVAGLLGMAPDDERIPQSLTIAAEAGLRLAFRPVAGALTLHPNTVRLQLRAPDGQSLDLYGVSRGGGLISIIELDGFQVNFSAQLPTLVIDADDVKGSIAIISTVIANDGVNIATMHVARKAKAELAKMVIEMDQPLSEVPLAYLRYLPWVHRVIALEPVP
ncbi:MAG: L-serine ammonia-lyase, iron-sulfur-dependent subunit beta [Bacteroidetes bacterium]|nr:L-serine ammonia-lyase, iron-sulfur-dependent subunit beta [Rhodothermia bacterium]MCS7155931.1 L-serine ammonia-lyase, iron-sulfur-dependent subunit beta [Bacteroidota bacterium]MCX7905937.1 L-serine ammonia-lyase, iron-sulfur-dependent subunit beta [Bacteroidota bacterium]MDW8138096.1 L-serine ammonia-lyase, iron-sulfur-dependent subunit beta [Bacteroidota bacterium]MDW8285780.1 L-serine ammonia-lyase, iron-sulfur-dependent subunit beta [Bacteroidota bacterium]